MENYIESKELQEMKQQISLLKDKLEQQTIVNDRMVRRAMKQGVSGLNRMGRLAMLMCYLCAVPCACIFHENGLSLWFSAFTVVMLLFSGTMTWYYHRDLWRTDPSETDLVTLASIVSRLKQSYVGWLRIAIPMILFWAVWMMTEAFLRLEAQPLLKAFIPGAFFGLILGGFIGNRRRQRVIRQAEEVLKQIEELKRGEE